MLSKVQIINKARIEGLGLKAINAPTDDPELNEIFESVRDAVLEDHTWNFARRRAQVSAASPAPAFGWAYAYNFPNDPYCMRVWLINDDVQVQWESEGRQILTDEPGPINVRYIARITETGQFSATFNEALAARLAASTAFLKVDDTRRESDLWALYNSKMKIARSVDGQEGNPKRDRRSNYQKVR